VCGTLAWSICKKPRAAVNSAQRRSRSVLTEAGSLDHLIRPPQQCPDGGPGARPTGRRPMLHDVSDENLPHPR
jgi:hypothetical protein